MGKRVGTAPDRGALLFPQRAHESHQQAACFILSPNFRFSSTVSQGYAEGSWNTKAKLCFFGFAGSPSMSSSPDVGSCILVSRFRKVVFPHPVGPTTQMNSPFLMSKVMLSRTCSLPKHLVRFLDLYFHRSVVLSHVCAPFPPIKAQGPSCPRSSRAAS